MNSLKIMLAIQFDYLSENLCIFRQKIFSKIFVRIETLQQAIPNYTTQPIPESAMFGVMVHCHRCKIIGAAYAC